MELIAAATIWGLFTCFLVFPLLGLPPAMHRTAMALLVAELVVLGFWSYGRPGEPAAEAGRTAASVDIPLLAVALVVVALVRGLIGLRRARASRRREPGGARGGGELGGLDRARRVEAHLDDRSGSQPAASERPGQ